MTTELPSGTVTFLFTDIESSTKLWEKYPAAMKLSLSRHDELLRHAIESNSGRIIKTTGDGIHAAFDTAVKGIAASLAAQRALLAEKWDALKPQVIKVRMGVHTGEAELRGGDYYGSALNRAARLMSIGHGGQILISATTADLVRDQLPDGISLLELGEHRLKDLVRPERVFQLLHPDLPDEFPAIKSLDAFPNNLPVQLTSFVGREREMAEARARFQDARLLTLIGPGGTGKTRLALQLAADLLPSFADGVWVAELAPVADPALVLQTIGSVFGLHEQLGMPMTELVLNYLRAKHLLLVLDNCEHLIAVCAQLADQLLHSSPGLKILASSREAVGITGETIFRVPSLSLPRSESVTLQSVSESESVQLFLIRTRAANPKFSLTEQNAAVVYQICRRLDGIPLALELAAARSSVFSLEQIATRLDDRFRLLTGGSRTALPRQQTLRALIDWSYDLLPENERTLFRRLSVFAGGWSFEAAEVICSDLDVLSSLTQLVNKSLVTVDEEKDGGTRYRLLETVRQYARDKLLEGGESEQARNSHSGFFYEFVKTAEPKLVELVARVWMNGLDTEYDNIRSALDWVLESNSLIALKMASALTNYWNRRGHESEGRHWISLALERSNQLPHPEGEEGRDQDKVLAEAWFCLGQLYMNQGDHVPGVEAFKRSGALARQLGDNHLLALTLAFTLVGSLVVGDSEGLNPIIDECLFAARKSGDKYALGISLSVGGQLLARMEGSTKIGTEYLQEGLRLLKESGNEWGTMLVILGMGLSARYHADFSEARIRFAACEPVFREMEDPHRVNMVRSELAHLERYEGHYQEALLMYRETIQEWERVGHRAAIAHQLECIATIAKFQEADQRAGVLFGAAEALRQKIIIPMTSTERIEYEREVADLRTGMEEKTFSLAWDEGRGMSMEQAIQYALQ